MKKYEEKRWKPRRMEDKIKIYTKANYIVSIKGALKVFPCFDRYTVRAHTDYKNYYCLRP